MDVRPGNMVVICDVRFEAAIGARVRRTGRGRARRRLEGCELDALPTLADRFEAAPGRIISVYLRTP